MWRKVTPTGQSRAHYVLVLHDGLVVSCMPWLAAGLPTNRAEGESQDPSGVYGSPGPVRIPTDAGVKKRRLLPAPPAPFCKIPPTSAVSRRPAASELSSSAARTVARSRSRASRLLRRVGLCYFSSCASAWKASSPWRFFCESCRLGQSVSFLVFLILYPHFLSFGGVLIYTLCCVFFLSFTLLIL